jgi:hypothetical protein
VGPSSHGGGSPCAEIKDLGGGGLTWLSRLGVWSVREPGPWTGGGSWPRDPCQRRAAAVWTGFFLAGVEFNSAVVAGDDCATYQVLTGEN